MTFEKGTLVRFTGPGKDKKIYRQQRWMLLKEGELGIVTKRVGAKGYEGCVYEVHFPSIAGSTLVKQHYLVQVSECIVK